MKRQPRPQARSLRSIEAILQAARTRFARDGFDLTSIEAIAADCERTKGAVYHHFGSKEQLFERVFILEQRRIADVVVAAASAPDPVTSFKDGILAYLDLIADDPDAAKLTLVDAPAVMGWEHWRRCDDGPFRALLRAAIEAIDDANRLRDGYEAPVLTELLLGAITEAGLTICASEDPATPARYQRSIEMLIADISRPLL